MIQLAKFFELPPEKIVERLDEEPGSFLQMPSKSPEWHLKNTQAYDAFIALLIEYGAKHEELGDLGLNDSLSSFYRDPKGKVRQFIPRLESDGKGGYQVPMEHIFLLHERERGEKTEFVPYYVPCDVFSQSVQIAGLNTTRNVVRFLEPIRENIGDTALRNLEQKPSTFMGLKIFHESPGKEKLDVFGSLLRIYYPKNIVCEYHNCYGTRACLHLNRS